jgi:hypothetical protein
MSKFEERGLLMFYMSSQIRVASAKSKSGRKSTLTERDHRALRRIVSKNHRTTAAQVTGQQK